MARPTKQGIDYFPLDCLFDNKTEMFLIEEGSNGLGILITLWQMIYSNQGYFINDNKDLHLLIKKKVDVNINVVAECIVTALRRGIFNEELFDKYCILTSPAIQKRFFFAARRKKVLRVCKEYLLSDINDYINLDNVDINWIDAGGNATKGKGKGKGKGNTKGNGKYKPEKNRPGWIPENLWLALLDNRKFKKLQNTELALTTFTNKLKEGVEAGFEIETCIGEFVASKWNRFDHSWIKINNDEMQEGPPLSEKEKTRIRAEIEELKSRRENV